MARSILQSAGSLSWRTRRSGFGLRQPCLAATSTTHSLSATPVMSLALFQCQHQTYLLKWGLRARNECRIAGSMSQIHICHLTDLEIVENSAIEVPLATSATDQ